MMIIIDDCEEVLRPITYPGVKDGCYLISNYGRVFSKLQNKFLKQVLNRCGYFEVYLRSDKKPRINITVHRLVAWEFCEGYSSTNNNVNHKDSVRTHNFYKNLEWISPSENTIHGLIHGNINRYGENNHTNKYSESMIIEIKSLIDKGFRDIDIMKHYGYQKTRDNISLRGLIYDVRHNKTWRHI